MRVITGTARGRKLVTLAGDDVRPTPEKVKEALFSAIQFDIEGRRVLDLFAGSGQLGIEALSRKASSAVFVDASQASLNIVKQNLEATGLTDRAKLVKSDFMPFTVTTGDCFDIAFLDPPYKAGLLFPALEKVTALMSSYGVIVCEHPETVSLPETVGGFSVSRRYSYGKIRLTVYRKEADSQ